MALNGALKEKLPVCVTMIDMRTPFPGASAYGTGSPLHTCATSPTLGGVVAYEMSCVPYTAMTGNVPGNDEYASPHDPIQTVDVELFVSANSTARLDQLAGRV